MRFPDGPLPESGGYDRGLMVTESTPGIGLFLYGLIRLFAPAHVVEAGAYHGHTSRFLDLALRHNGGGRLTLIEPGPWAVGLQESFPGADVWNVRAQDLELPTCDFLFLDAEPKGAYVEIMERCFSHLPAVVTAHDLDYRPGDLDMLRVWLMGRGYSVAGLHRERGLLVGVREA